MNKVDTWGETNQTSGIIKDGVEVSEERLTENPGGIIVILEGQEALVFLADVDDVGLWDHLDVVSVVDEERDVLVQVDVAWTVEETVVIAPDVRLVVEEGAEHLGADGVRDLDERVEGVQEGFFFWEVES